MIRSHKTRLTAAASVATGLLLAILFAIVYFIAQDNALSQKRADLISAMGAVAGDPANLEIDEFVESHPTLSLMVYKDNGNLIARHGSIYLPKTIGMHRDRVAMWYGVHRGKQVIVDGGDLTDINEAQARLLSTLELLWFPLTLFVGVVTWISAWLTFKPLERLAQQASEMKGQFFGRRLNSGDDAEFGRFADQLNRMLDQIEETVKREDQFASDAAHEFRTPLAIMRARIETTLLKTRSPQEYIHSHQALLTELDRLTRIVEALLRTARRIPTDVPPVDVEPLVQEAANRWQDRYIEREVFLAVHTETSTACIAPEEIAVILDNLLDNALRFAPGGSTVGLDLRQTEESIEWTVSDEGPGVPDNLGNKIFERLVRSDDSRNRESGGAGIGLAVCRKILESRGGSIALRESAEAHGATFVCRVARRSIDLRQV